MHCSCPDPFCLKVRRFHRELTELAIEVTAAALEAYETQRRLDERMSAAIATFAGHIQPPLQLVKTEATN